MEGNTGNNMELSLNDISLRTMNIINRFFPIEENFAYLKKYIMKEMINLIGKN